ncbi:MAG: hypothetical protein K5Q00_02430, partial [Gammaproteobacteria bacterium]|nr:hypothetical protein [Gammaproteobacteria bacterium]
HSALSSFYVSDNGVFVCGENVFGQLGLGPPQRGLVDRLTPVKLPPCISIKTIVAGHFCTYFLTSDGAVFACGRNPFGELGLGHSRGVDTPTEVTIPNHSRIETIVSNSGSTFFLTTDGAVFSCGRNDGGQLGLGHSRDVNTPTEVTIPNRSRIETIAPKFGSTFFLTTDRTVLACGCNDKLRPGLRPSKIWDKPTEVPMLNNTVIKAIELHMPSTFFITEEGHCGMLSLEPVFAQTPLHLFDTSSFSAVIKTLDPGNSVCTLLDADGRIITFDRQLNPATLVSFLSLLPPEIIAANDLTALQLNQLKSNKPVGWFYHTTINGITRNKFTHFQYEIPESSRPTQQPVYMTRWLLSYPMKKLKKTLSNKELPLAEITAARNECDQKFTELLNLIESGTPLLLEHTEKSITPEIMDLACACLNHKNFQRLIGHLSRSQAQQWLSVTLLGL